MLQREFVRLLVWECRSSAAEAARRAGYSPRNAQVAASKNLSKPKIRAAVRYEEGRRRAIFQAVTHDDVKSSLQGLYLRLGSALGVVPGAEVDGIPALESEDVDGAVRAFLKVTDQLNRIEGVYHDRRRHVHEFRDVGDMSDAELDAELREAAAERGYHIVPDTER